MRSRNGPPGNSTVLQREQRDARRGRTDNVEHGVSTVPRAYRFASRSSSFRACRRNRRWTSSARDRPVAPRRERRDQRSRSRRHRARSPSGAIAPPRPSSRSALVAEYPIGTAPATSRSASRCVPSFIVLERGSSTAIMRAMPTAPAQAVERDLDRGRMMGEIVVDGDAATMPRTSMPAAHAAEFAQRRDRGLDRHARRAAAASTAASAFSALCRPSMASHVADAAIAFA